MLPAELLAVQRWRDNIRPKYSRLDEVDVSVAEAVIQVYESGVGLKREMIREKILELEDAFRDYRFVRGLAALVERECTFTPRLSVNPLKIRHMLFSEASKRGFPTSAEERRSILEAVASNLNVSVEQVESSIYADLDSEEVLESCPKFDAVQLLKQYNLSLTQTLLFYSTEMEFTASGNWQRIFRAIKYHGLMYTAAKRSGTVVVKVDGPTSLFKLTRRYGTALAKVVPEIMKGGPWRVEAKILRANRLLNFVLESSRHGWLFPQTVQVEGYDSIVEEEFAEEFRNLRSPWRLQRESEPVEAGASIMIPDFTFKLGEVKVYMEIVGFWTQEYMKRKLAKLAEVNTPFIVAVDEELACDKLAHLEASNPNVHVIYYRGRVPVGEVLRILRPLAEAELRNQASKAVIVPKKPVTTLKELAEEYGLIEEAVRQAAERIGTHMLVGETLIEKELLERVKLTLEKALDKEKPLLEVLKTIEAYNLPDPVTVITSLGYKVRWRGLSLENATVYKPAQI